MNRLAENERDGIKQLIGWAGKFNVAGAEVVIIAPNLSDLQRVAARALQKSSFGLNVDMCKEVKLVRVDDRWEV